MSIGVPCKDESEEKKLSMSGEKRNKLIRILDQNGTPRGSGDVMSFDEVHAEGHWHRVVLVCIVNAKNQILLQQRSKFVAKYPNVWDISVASHVLYGEYSIDAAKRSIIEELKIPLKHEIRLNDFRYITCFRKEDDIEAKKERQFHDLFFVRLEGDMPIEKIAFNENDVQNVKWESHPGILDMNNGNEFFPRTEWISPINEYLIRGL